MSERVLAIVVSYNPEIQALKRSLGQLIEQGCDPVVVDNASGNAKEVGQLCAELTPTVFIAQAKNMGLGAAHNKGVGYAREHAYTHVLLMDQDSIPLRDMVERLLAAHRIKSTNGKVSAVGVTYLNADNGSESFFVRFGVLKFKRQYCGHRDDDGCLPADFLISSGSLIELSTLEKIGDMDEGLFIDHVDTEWFLRARSQGYSAYGVCDAVMQHGLGENTHRVSLGGRQRNVPQHKSFRYYYIFRNSVLLYKRGYASLFWKWNDVQRLGMILLMFGLFKSPRVENLSMMLKGAWHGLRGVTGPLNDA